VTKFLLLAALLSAPTLAAAQIQRCEGPDGKVTYSNESCPTGTKLIKNVDTRPQVTEADAKSAKTRAQREAEEAKAIDKQRADEEQSLARARDAARKKEEALERECNKKRIVVNKAKEAVESSALNRRAELEKKLERAQADFDKSCSGR
jgi:hypothetical protein